MPARIPAWAIYDVFATADGEQVFVGVVTNTQWRTFCEVFELPQFADDPTLASNALRVTERDRFMPVVRALFLPLTRAQVVSACEKAGVSFAPIAKPEELFDDPHLSSPGAMVEITLADGRRTTVPALPLEMNGQRFGRRLDVPRVGEHGAAIARELGYSAEAIAALAAEGVVGL